MSLATAPVRPDQAVVKPAFKQTSVLFLVSLLGLFLELLLIRWIGTEIRIFAYLQNTVLVVCFLGLGMGCWTCRRPFVLREFLVPLAILVFLLALPITRLALGGISDLLSVGRDFLIWRQEVSNSPTQAIAYMALGLALTFLLMVLIWDVFVPIGRLMGRLMDDHPRPIWAYSVNVAGSLLGIWLFVLLSVFNQPPVAWFAIAIGLLLGLSWYQQAAVSEKPSCSLRRQGVNALLLVAILGLSWLAGREAGALEVWWSPYQKLVLREADPSKADIGGIGEYVVNVNNTDYQEIIDLGAAHVQADPQRYPPELRGLSQYDLPLLFHPSPHKLLVVGAGTGNDVAGGLRHGARDITAVDIDPVILSMGQRFHPEKPYADTQKVQLVTDDARSFFATCQERFDLIAFGLLDSHTTASMTNARLDHYVYTRESIQRAKTLLADGGVLVLSFLVQKPFIADRMAGALRDVFGEEPICFVVPKTSFGRGGVMFVAGDLASVRRQIAGNPRLAAALAQWQEDKPVPLPGVTPIATDDWPYIYLESPNIPLLHYLLAGLLFLLLLRGLWRLRAPGLFSGWGISHWHFFFLGAAFLLLEVQNISKAAVVLGSTWWVNAVIISSILVLILVANWIGARCPQLPLWPVYGLLCASCIALYFIDISQLGFLPFATKAILVGGLTSLPMLFSGIVFIRSFARVPRKDVALGANLFGALVGGLLQSVTFVTGIKFLLLMVAGLYIAASLSRPRGTGDPFVQPDAVAG